MPGTGAPSIANSPSRANLVLLTDDATHYCTWLSTDIGNPERRRSVMSGISAFVSRHRLAAFFILAYALSWWAWIPYTLGVFPNPVASFGPFLAALVVLALTEGKTGLLGLFRRMIRWRVAPGWYAVALFATRGACHRCDSA